jgi:hypothetical protein
VACLAPNSVQAPLATSHATENAQKPQLPKTYIRPSGLRPNPTSQAKRGQASSTTTLEGGPVKLQVAPQSQQRARDDELQSELRPYTTPNGRPAPQLPLDSPPRDPPTIHEDTCMDHVAYVPDQYGSNLDNLFNRVSSLSQLADPQSPDPKGKSGQTQSTQLRRSARPSKKPTLFPGLVTTSTKPKTRRKQTTTPKALKQALRDANLHDSLQQGRVSSQPLSP